MIHPWQQIHSEALGDFHVFSVRADHKISPRTGQGHEFIVLDCVDWVNVIALTADDHLVLVEQFRHGSNAVELEIPGGLMDPHEVSPIDTGIRELREETGYEGEQAVLLGSVLPNPAIMSNTCYTVLVRNCRLRHPVALDQGEDIATRLVPAVEIPTLIRAGRIRHSLVVVALYYFELWQHGHPSGHPPHLEG